MPPRRIGYTLPLTARQKNELADYAESLGLALADFAWRRHEIMPGTPTESVKYKPFVAYFFFYASEAGDTEVGYQVADGTSGTLSVHDWHEATTHFRTWLSLIRREADERSVPDRWDAAIGEAQSLTPPSAPFDDNSPFTESEQREIDEEVDRIIEDRGIRGLLSPEERKRLVEGGNWLKRLARTAGRIDWKNSFVGWLVSEVANFIKKPETRQAIFSAAQTLLKAIFSHNPQLPPGMQ